MDLAYRKYRDSVFIKLDLFVWVDIACADYGYMDRINAASGKLDHGFRPKSADS